MGEFGGTMGEFGAELKRLRAAAGLRQQDLSARLGGAFARSTLANVESGRERPSVRLWQALQDTFPEWTDSLAPAYAGLRPDPEGAPPAMGELGGPFTLEEVSYVYTFRDHRAPEEIIEVRRVRALRDGAAGYGLKFSTDSAAFEMETEALWGGYLDTSLRINGSGDTLYLTRFAFDRTLRRGDHHSFAVRSWITRDEDPDTAVTMGFTLPVGRATIHLNFLGPTVPASSWSFGPLADELLIPTHPEDGTPVAPLPNHSLSVSFPRPVPGSLYGVAWAWPE